MRNAQRPSHPTPRLPNAISCSFQGILTPALSFSSFFYYTPIPNKIKGLHKFSQPATTASPVAAVWGCRGGLYGRPGRTPGISGLSVIATQLWRHGGMPPYGVRRGCGGKCRHFGRICNPPLQVRSLPFPAVGAHYICARDARPGLSGLRSTGPGRGGMWACRPTRFDEGAVRSGGCSGG